MIYGGNWHTSYWKVQQFSSSLLPFGSDIKCGSSCIIFLFVIYCGGCCAGQPASEAGKPTKSKCGGVDRVLYLAKRDMSFNPHSAMEVTGWPWARCYLHSLNQDLTDDILLGRLDICRGGWFRFYCTFVYFKLGFVKWPEPWGMEGYNYLNKPINKCVYQLGSLLNVPISAASEACSEIPNGP